MRSKPLTFLIAVAIAASACKKEAKQTPVTLSKVNSGSLETFSLPAKAAVTGTIKGFMRIQVAADAVNTDDILLNFNSAASVAFSRTEDAPTFNGAGYITLSSLSSDNVALAINALPLPVTRENVKLMVHAKADGTYKLNLSAISNIPSIFEVWLMDAYKKDSLDLRANPSYIFDLKLADTNSYGSGRFSILIRQNPGLAVHLLGLNAASTAGAAKIGWVTENEQSFTAFSVERSIDNGNTYYNLNSMLSSGTGAYSYTDTAPMKGTDMYRVKITDLNGMVTYSAAVTKTF